ncbi:MAG: hypothetical protein LBG10_01030, partial [Treponema sp.]|nr:hypothetical protein [Treponema sp.]
LLPDISYHVEQGLGNAAAYLSNSGGFRDAKNAAVFEPYACQGGCANGTGVGNRGIPKDSGFLAPRGQGDLTNIYNLFSYYDETLKLEDFCCSGTGLR